MASPKVVLYTAIFGPFDQLKPMTFVDDFDYFCISDRAIDAPKPWKIISVSRPSHDRSKSARYFKHKPSIFFSHYDYNIWLDATHFQKSSLLGLIGVQDICAMSHYESKTIMDEFESCVRLRKDNPDLMKMQVDSYYRDGFDDSTGVFSTACLIRRNTKSVEALQEIWWQQIDRWSRRDQISFPYCLWKLKMSCGVIPGFCRSFYHSDYFSMKPHALNAGIPLL